MPTPPARDDGCLIGAWKPDTDERRLVADSTAGGPPVSRQVAARVARTQVTKRAAVGCGHRLGEGSRSARTGLLRRAALALWPAHGIRRCRCRTNSRARRGAAVVGVVARSRDVAGAQHLCLMRRAPRGCLPPVLGVLAGGFGPSLPDRTLLDEVSVIYVLHRDRRHINPLGHCSTELIRGSSADGNVDPNRGSGSGPKGAQRSFDPHGTPADSVRHL